MRVTFPHRLSQRLIFIRWAACVFLAGIHAEAWAKLDLRGDKCDPIRQEYNQLEEQQRQALKEWNAIGPWRENTNWHARMDRAERKYSSFFSKLEAIWPRLHACEDALRAEREMKEAERRAMEERMRKIKEQAEKSRLENERRAQESRDRLQQKQAEQKAARDEAAAQFQARQEQIREENGRMQREWQSAGEQMASDTQRIWDDARSRISALGEKYANIRESFDRKMERIDNAIVDAWAAADKAARGTSDGRKTSIAKAKAAAMSLANAAGMSKEFQERIDSALSYQEDSQRSAEKRLVGGLVKLTTGGERYDEMEKTADAMNALRFDGNATAQQEKNRIFAGFAFVEEAIRGNPLGGLMDARDRLLGETPLTYPETFDEWYNETKNAGLELFTNPGTLFEPGKVMDFGKDSAVSLWETSKNVAWNANPEAMFMGEYTQGIARGVWLRDLDDGVEQASGAIEKYMDKRVWQPIDQMLGEFNVSGPGPRISNLPSYGGGSSSSSIGSRYPGGGGSASGFVGQASGAGAGFTSARSPSATTPPSGPVNAFDPPLSSSTTAPSNTLPPRTSASHTAPFPSAGPAHSSVSPAPGHSPDAPTPPFSGVPPAIGQSSHPPGSIPRLEPPSTPLLFEPQPTARSIPTPRATAPPPSPAPAQPKLPASPEIVPAPNDSASPATLSKEPNKVAPPPGSVATPKASQSAPTAPPAQAAVQINISPVPTAPPGNTKSLPAAAVPGIALNVEAGKVGRDLRVESITGRLATGGIAELHRGPQAVPGRGAHQERVRRYMEALRMIGELTSKIAEVTRAAEPKKIPSSKKQPPSADAHARLALQDQAVRLRERAESLRPEAERSLDMIKLDAALARYFALQEKLRLLLQSRGALMDERDRCLKRLDLYRAADKLPQILIDGLSTRLVELERQIAEVEEEIAPIRGQVSEMDYDAARLGKLWERAFVTDPPAVLKPAGRPTSPSGTEGKAPPKKSVGAVEADCCPGLARVEITGGKK